MSNKPRVLQVLYSGLGGHGSVFTSIVEGDKEGKVENLALFYGTEPAKPEYVDFCREKGIEYYYVSKEQGADMGSWKEVYNVFRKCRPDVIVLHSINLVPVALAYHRLNKCRMMLVEHTPIDVKPKQEWAYTFLSMVGATNVVMLTEEQTVSLRAAMGAFYRPANVVIINNGIDTDKFAPLPQRPQQPELIISMQARFSASKDQKTLVQAFAQVLGSYKGPKQLKLVLAGDGEMLADVQQEAERLALQNSVVFTGMLQEKEVVELLQRSDLYVHSSLAETMSTAVIQALSCGLPIVASDIPGINNMISSGQNGLLFSKGNKAALEQTMLSLLGNEEERRRLGTNARAYAVQNLSHTKMFSAYYKLYTS